MASKKSWHGLNEHQFVHLFSQKRVHFSCKKKIKSLDGIWIFKFHLSLISIVFRVPFRIYRV